MLNESHLNKYADVLLWGLKTARRGRFRKRDVILLQHDRAALRLAEILYEKIIAAGMNPIQRAGLTVPMERAFYGKAGGRQLIFQPPGEKELCGNLHGRIYLHAPDSLTHLKDVPPARIGRVLVARKPLRDILERREQEGCYGWTLCTLPTEKLAAQARTTPELYAEQIIRACYLDRENPVAEWEAIRRQANAIKKWLGGLKAAFFHIESAHCDLRITPGAERKWAGVSGHNIPSFELFVSPDWRGAEGTYFANLPSYRSGNYVEGVRLVFSRGVATEISAETGGAFTVAQLRMDPGAGRIGEFSLTDRRFSRIDRFMADTLFDENFGGEHGNCHIAVGASYTDTYAGDPAAMTRALKRKLGFNDSALHWDLVNTEAKTVTAHLTTGKRIVIYEDGQFRY
ncbi:MAG: aminopeptidase [Proteobacteria bacterium]|nr:aminopeptidase [Pseudomonadota bacterium]MBU2226439.1 aminopeptidase [Pseudomonadota bacterium]MBU2260442.1 aminopeptidase [Pseudomonadota bacterium]